MIVPRYRRGGAREFCRRGPAQIDQLLRAFTNCYDKARLKLRCCITCRKRQRSISQWPCKYGCPVTKISLIVVKRQKEGVLSVKETVEPFPSNTRFLYGALIKLVGTPLIFIIPNHPGNLSKLLSEKGFIYTSANTCKALLLSARFLTTKSRAVGLMQGEIQSHRVNQFQPVAVDPALNLISLCHPIPGSSQYHIGIKFMRIDVSTLRASRPLTHLTRPHGALAASEIDQASL